MVDKGTTDSSETVHPLIKKAMGGFETSMRNLEGAPARKKEARPEATRPTPPATTLPTPLGLRPRAQTHQENIDVDIQHFLTQRV